MGRNKCVENGPAGGDAGVVEVPAGLSAWVQSSELKMKWGGGVGGAFGYQ